MEAREGFFDGIKESNESRTLRSFIEVRLSFFSFWHLPTIPNWLYTMRRGHAVKRYLLPVDVCADASQSLVHTDCLVSTEALSR